VLEGAGVEVSAVNLASEEHPEEVDYPSADWYGVSCVSAVYPDAKKLVPILRKKGMVAMGGVHPTIMPDFVSKDAKPDLLITGEAEFLFRDVVTDKIPPRPIMHAGIIENLDSLPIPARHLFLDADVVDTTGIHGQEKGVPATTVMTSRGCPWHCTTCTKDHPMFTKYRFRSAEHVRRELVQIRNRYGVQHVRFVDDEFTVNRARTLKLMKEIRGLGLTWICITRCDTVDGEMLREMRLSGCVEVHVGIECFSDRVLTLMNKQTTEEILEKGCRLIKRAGIRLKTYLMASYPGMLPEDQDKTVDFVKRVKPDKFTLSRFTPLPGSAMWGKVEPRGDGWFYPDNDKDFLQYREQLREAAHQ
jgi:radical SAM superfamily enzyme YgiQ (UPF0313 family)